MLEVVECLVQLLIHILVLLLFLLNNWLFSFLSNIFNLLFFLIIFIVLNNFLAYCFTFHCLLLHFLFLYLSLNHFCKKVILHLLIRTFLALVIKSFFQLHQILIATDLRWFQVIINHNSHRGGYLHTINHHNLLVFFEQVLLILVLLAQIQTVLVEFLEFQTVEVNFLVILGNDLVKQTHLLCSQCVGFALDLDGLGHGWELLLLKNVAFSFLLALCLFLLLLNILLFLYILPALITLLYLFLFLPFRLPFFHLVNISLTLLIIILSLISLHFFHKIVFFLFWSFLIDNKIASASNLFPHKIRNVHILGWFAIYHYLVDICDLAYDIPALSLSKTTFVGLDWLVEHCGFAVDDWTRGQGEPDCFF